MRNLLFILLFIVFYACSMTREHTDFRFAKGGFLLQQPTLLKTDGVYLNNTVGVNYEGKTITGYSFYRFYENGRCYVSTWQEGTPNDSILKSTDKGIGQRTFFRNEGNNVRIELWGGSYTGYIYRYATIDSNFLLINAFKSREFWTKKQKYKVDLIYEYIPLNLSEKEEW